MTVISKRRSACAAACIIMLGALTACAKREESARAPMAVEPSMSEAAPLTVTPPPSRAASIERQLAGLGAEQSDRGLVVQLPGGQFAPGQTRFEPAETTRMERVADLLRERPELQVRVIGHTDSRGSQAVNARIARERAEAAREALIALGDIDPQRIAAEGVGEVQPVAPNDTAEGREKNRRVELVITDRTGRFASSAAATPTG